MRINQQVDRLKFLVKLLQEERTGAAGKFANRIGVSRSKLFEILEELKGAGAQIEYNRRRNSYYLKDGCSIRINQPIEIEAAS